MRYIPDEEPYFFYQLERQERRQKMRAGNLYARRAEEKKKPFKVAMAEEIFQILESSVEKIGGLYENK